MGGKRGGKRSGRRARRRAWALAGALGLGPALALAWLNRPVGPLWIEPLRRGSGDPVVDEDLDLARRYAPWIRKAVHPTRGRQDLPAPVDFDGDLDGENAWESFPHYELVPTVYYAVLETETHWFLTYHLFHPRDWTRFDLGLHLSHENDGENMQIVVSKAEERPVLLFTQAHYRGEGHARGDFLTVDAAGRPDPEGAHACVFVESGGHGILRAESLEARPGVRSMRVARAGEAVREPDLAARDPIPYQLESTTAKLWPLLRGGELVGEGRLLDGVLPYADERVAIGVPRYYEADRFSGPFGPDRGISPFAVDFGFEAGTLGALFFDPARRWAECFPVPEPWGLEYLGYPFGGE